MKAEKKNVFSKDTKFAELMTEDRRLLQLLPRFGIGLGFGDRSVEHVCQMNHVGADLFLMVCGIYCDSTFKPDENALQRVDMNELLSYLKASHRYYLEERFPHNTSSMPAGGSLARCSANSMANTSRK